MRLDFNFIILSHTCRYRLKPPGGGLRTKVVKLEGWIQLLNDAHLMDSQFTIQDATLAFLWSRSVEP